VLAAVGVFGVLAFSVNQRLREFGIRLALGARPAEVRRLVMMGGIRIAATGTIAGLAAASVLTRALESLLFGVRPFDLPAFLVAPAALIATTLIACLLPALRAARVEPASALRHE
jgi:ABC-type lipoprotein release transport system permease subunit